MIQLFGSAAHNTSGVVVPISPEMARIKTACQIYGVSRSWIYRQAPSHPGLLRKCGRSTLVDLSVLRAILAALPVADIRQSPAHSQREAA